jgi:hypothetical protein
MEVWTVGLLLLDRKFWCTTVETLAHLCRWLILFSTLGYFFVSHSIVLLKQLTAIFTHSESMKVCTYPVP